MLWTDSLQMILMLTAIFGVIIKCSIDLGVPELWRIAEEGGRTNMLTCVSVNRIYRGANFTETLKPQNSLKHI